MFRLAFQIGDALQGFGRLRGVVSSRLPQRAGQRWPRTVNNTQLNVRNSETNC